MPGLSADVRIDWTQGGIAHLDAGCERDLFFAQGYLTASERFFQLDLTRRTARGELSQLFGARPAPWRELSVAFQGGSLVEVDLFMRQLSLVGAAHASLDVLSPESHAHLEAYAAGVNAWLSEGRRPIELQWLQDRPRPWTALDSVTVWKALAFQLSFGWRAGLAAEGLRAHFADRPERARALWPRPSSFPPEDALLPKWPQAGHALRVIENVAGKRGPVGPALGGSNGFVAGPGRTSSGRVVLAGDPHLPLRAPSPGYLLHLHAGDFNVAGWTVPGVPGVVMGHNERTAWTVTSGCILDAAWAFEEPSVDGTQLRTSKGFEPLSTEWTELFVRGEPKPLRRQLSHGPNGPVFDRTILPDAPERHLLSLRWTGHLASADLDALFAMNRSSSVKAIRDAAQKFASPAVNVVAGDVDGNIGWMLAGVAPRFRGRAPIGAVPGWSAEHEWDGLRAPDEMPFVENPADGFIVSANQRPFPGGGPIDLGDLFEPPYRARRLRQGLLDRPKLSLDDASALQLDRHSGFGADLLTRYLRPLRERWRAERSREGSEELRVLEVACGWDGISEVESAGAAVVWTLLPLLARQLFEPLLGERLFLAVFESFNLPLVPMLSVLEQGGAPFFGPDELDAAATVALRRTGAQLVSACGGSPGSWRLGAVRRVEHRHPMSELPLVGRLTTVGPVGHGGDGTSVNAAFSRLSGDGLVELGPVFRHAVECGAWDGYRVVLATGQGGDPTTLRYRDHFEAWRKGGSFVLPFGPEAIARDREHEARWSPAPAQSP